MIVIIRTYRKFPYKSRLPINRRLPFERRVQVHVLVNNGRFQMNALIHLKKKTTKKNIEDDVPCSLPAVVITVIIAMAPVQRRQKKYDLKFKLSVIKYAEEKTFRCRPKRTGASACVRGGQQPGQAAW